VAAAAVSFSVSVSRPHCKTVRVILCKLLVHSDHPELSFGLFLCGVPEALLFSVVDKSILKVCRREKKNGFFCLLVYFYLKYELSLM